MCVRWTFVQSLDFLLDPDSREEGIKASIGAEASNARHPFDILLVAYHSARCRQRCHLGVACAVGKRLLEHLYKVRHRTTTEACDVMGCQLIRLLDEHWAHCRIKARCKHCRGLHRIHKKDAAQNLILELLA